MVVARASHWSLGSETCLHETTSQCCHCCHCCCSSYCGCCCYHCFCPLRPDELAFEATCWRCVSVLALPVTAAALGNGGVVGGGGVSQQRVMVPSLSARLLCWCHLWCCARHAAQFCTRPRAMMSGSPCSAGAALALRCRWSLSERLGPVVAALAVAAVCAWPWPLARVRVQVRVRWKRLHRCRDERPTARSLRQS